MSEGFSRRELVTGAAALMLGEKLAAQEAGSPQKKTYQVELAVPKVVTITVSFDARNRTIVASPDNGSARLNMDDTLVIISHETFTVQFTPLNGGPPHPFVKWPEGNENLERLGIFKGTRFEAVVKGTTTLPLPFYSYTIGVGSSVLDPLIIIDGRALYPWIQPWICTAGCPH